MVLAATRVLITDSSVACTAAANIGSIFQLWLDLWHIERGYAAVSGGAAASFSFHAGEPGLRLTTKDTILGSASSDDVNDGLALLRRPRRYCGSISVSTLVLPVFARSPAFIGTSVGATTSH